MIEIPRELYELLRLLTSNQMAKMEDGCKAWNELTLAFNRLGFVPVKSDGLAEEVERSEERIKALIAGQQGQ
jgi:hypothetical protein